jgi:hypothetical protein
MHSPWDSSLSHNLCPFSIFSAFFHSVGHLLITLDIMSEVSCYVTLVVKHRILSVAVEINDFHSLLGIIYVRLESALFLIFLKIVLFLGLISSLLKLGSLIKL